MLKVDKSNWEVCNDDDPNNYRVVSTESREIIARDVSLDAATQIVDEHLIVRRIMTTIAEREAATLAVFRAPL